ncbi:MAG TPA: hypothetical protein VFT22_01595 [Kofleriaceae bacterium]|nr:hypothetical protein [Kofleriaceae bacterium]
MANLADHVVALRRALVDGTDHVDPFNGVIDAGASAGPDARTQAIRALLSGLAGAPPATLGELAVASGALVEQGASATESLGVLLDALAAGATSLAAAPGLADADLDRGAAPRAMAPPARDWAGAYHRLVVGAMARLARSTEARALARAHSHLDAAIRALAGRIQAWHVTYLHEVLDMLDDAPLLLVDTATDTITRLRVTGIRNCFHLITLLEGHDPFDLVGDTLSTGRGYYTWRYLGVTSDRAIDIVQTMIPGDLRARDLPAFEGTRVVVRTPTGVRRSWDTSFVAPIHDALRSTIVTEAELAPAAARALRDRMAAG